MNTKASSDISTRAPSAERQRKEALLLAQAELLFAQYGFEGTALETIANAAGFSRHRLLYYFPSKEALYLRVLDSVLDAWLSGMQDLSQSTSPWLVLQRYVHSKLEFSRQRPQGVKVFTTEIMAGAPHYKEIFLARVGPMLASDRQAFERWAKQGLIQRVDFTHLMFILWSVTQAYADQQAQFSLLLGKPALDDGDFAQAEKLITQMIFAVLSPDKPA